MSQAPTNGLYSGYHNRPKAAVANPLTQTTPGSDGGEYLRRYWHPIALSSEVGALPKAIRILSEDLVLFREHGGKLGLLHRQCIHRGASLEFGIPQERGIMCCYHGWVFDTTGAVLSVGAEPETSRIPANFGQGAYPVREAHGMIFAYMGPPESMPEFPIYDTFLHPIGNDLVPLKLTIPCNWLQIVENACDPIHNAYLHAIVSGEQFSAAFKVQPALDFVETPLGFLSMATRHVKDKVYIRASDIILPNVAQFAAGSNDASTECFNISCGLTRWVVPIDDRNSLYIGYGHYNERTEQFRRAPAEELAWTGWALSARPPTVRTRNARWNPAITTRWSRRDRSPIIRQNISAPPTAASSCSAACSAARSKQCEPAKSRPSRGSARMGRCAPIITNSS